jgi:hypothetical protein
MLIMRSGVDEIRDIGFLINGYKFLFLYKRLLSKMLTVFTQFAVGSQRHWFL